MRLTIASRKSDLARIQAYIVGRELEEKHFNLKLEYQFRSSLGDKNQHDPLWEMPSIGVFTEDFRKDLLSGKVDMVVHSWKDLPTQIKGGTILAATVKRADHRDLLLVKKSNISKIKKSRSMSILSSSPRRIYNLENFLKRAFPLGLDEVVFETVRGNIQTRLDKLLVQDIDGIIVAKAAVDRLLTSGQWSQKGDNFSKSASLLRAAIDQCKWMVLPASHNPPAAAQGALAIEIAEGRQDLEKYLAKINCQQTFNDVGLERSILATYGGGCHQKIGVWVQSNSKGKMLSLRGETDDGEKLEQFTLLPAKKTPKRISSAQIFDPYKLVNIFKRETITPTQEIYKQMEKTNALFLASPRIPDEYLTRIDKQIVWTSGVTSWFKLAAKNIWINGVDDNLGSFENRNINDLLNASPNWLTLTHDDSPASPAIATYKLVPDGNEIELSGEKYFFWRSGSAFKRAIALKPEIKECNHSCGLGRTYDIIKEIIGDEGQLFPFIDETDWLNQMRSAKK